MIHASRHIVAALLVAPAALVLSACPEQPDDGAVDLELVTGERSEPDLADVQVRIEAPRGVVDTTAPSVELSVTGFEVGGATPGAGERGLALSEKGQHIHLILNNRPYQAVYDVSGPVELADAPLEPGVHVLRAFASRQWHEGVKSADAFDITFFVVGDTAPGAADVQPPYGPDEPMLTYSRPKGTYQGADADSILVDFHLRNAELGPDAHKVRLTVNDTVRWLLDDWAPHYLVGLSEGEHQIRLELMAVEPVPGEFNSTERTITVVRDTAAGDAADESRSGEGDDGGP